MIQNNRLRIFDIFEIDYQLPKYNKTRSDESAQIGEAGLIQILPQDDIAIKYNSKKKRKLWNIFKHKEHSANKEIKEIKKITVFEFFSHIKNNLSEIENIKDRSESLELLINKANQFGQIALKEKILKNLNIIKAETQLYAINYIKYLTEENIIKFANECEKGLELTWIKNFTNIIPNDFLIIKNKCDELEIFDNYVILHYDPEKKSIKETEEDIRKRKDPIIFGVIANSRKLYYLYDWVDEYCDLTLEQIVDKIGQDSISKISKEINSI